jgi:hypothetical protein
MGLQRAAQVLETERIDRMRTPAWIEHEAGKHGVVGDARELNARGPQDLPVELDVVTCLRDCGIGQQLRQRGTGRIAKRGQVAHRRRIAELGIVG